ncbi:MAG: hypothetical protein KAX11_02430, partial [Candidatus Aminicenantes bacterium]|nr:hypothetical protein [Candidatus Aminicenantes bacterium]
LLITNQLLYQLSYAGSPAGIFRIIEINRNTAISQDVIEIGLLLESKFIIMTAINENQKTGTSRI